MLKHNDSFFNNIPFKVAGELIHKFNISSEDSPDRSLLAKKILTELNKVLTTNKPCSNEEKVSLSDVLFNLLKHGPVTISMIDKAYINDLSKLEHLGLTVKIPLFGQVLHYAVSYCGYQILSESLINKETEHTDKNKNIDLEIGGKKYSCVSSGLYDTTYECTDCGFRFTYSLDRATSENTKCAEHACVISIKDNGK